MFPPTMHLWFALLLVTPLVTGHEEAISLPHSLEAEEEGGPVSADAAEHLPERRLDLEDHGEWSASGEVLDENHAWFRRRRSLATEEDGGSRTPNNAGEKRLEREGRLTSETRREDEFPAQEEDMEAAESAVFMPSFMRVRKKVAHEECRARNEEFRTWKRHHSRTHTHRHTRQCNDYCCFTLTDV